MVRLRGHHLVCLNFFRGGGYNREFRENLAEVIAKAEKGDKIEVIQGADDVCRSCPDLKDGKCAHTPDSDAGIRQLDAKAAARLGVSPGDTVLWREMKARVAATPKEWFLSFCDACEWEKTCVERKKNLGVL
ncbi:MAG: DUF1284 domain-containing protein [Bacillota bacterium]